MGLLLILVGCVVLFVPTYNLIDVPPDFFGVVMLLCGMSKLADLNSHVATAYAKMKSAAWVTLGKLVCFALFGVLDSTMKITLTLAFGVLECVFLIPALAELFEGLSALVTGSVAVADKITSGIKPLTAIFFVTRALSSVFPDAAAMIYETSTGAVTSNAMTPERLRAVLLIVFMAATLFLGVMWLIYVSGIVTPARRDKEFISSLEKRYESEVLSNEEKLTSRRVGRFCLLTSAALIPFITLRVDGIYFLPEFAFGIVMLVANVITDKYAKDKKLTLLLSVFTAVGAAGYAMMILYSEKFGDLFMPFDTEGFLPIYASVTALELIMFVLFAVSGKRTADVLRKITADTVGLGGRYTDERRRDIDAERKRKIFGKIKFAEILLYVYAAVGALSVAALPFFEAAWLVRLAAGGVMFAVWLWVTRTVSSEAEYLL